MTTTPDYNAIFEELGEAQLLALSQAEIDRWIDRLAMQAGVPLLAPLPPMPDAADVSEDVNGYALPSGLYFVNEADARRIADLATACPRVTAEYIPGPGYRMRWAPADGPVEVSTKRHFSPEKAQANAERIARYEREKAAYQSAKNAADDAQRKRRAIVERVTSAIEQARARQNERARLNELFERYLDLADGNRRVACNFMVAAYPGAPAVIPERFQPDEDGPVITARVYDLDEQPAAPAEEIV